MAPPISGESARILEYCTEVLRDGNSQKEQKLCFGCTTGNVTLVKKKRKCLRTGLLSPGRCTVHVGFASIRQPTLVLQLFRDRVRSDLLPHQHL